MIDKKTASPTPTDAQPKAANPVGDEALREALELAGIIRRDPDTGGLYVGRRTDTDLTHAIKGACSWLNFAHPTTGQETVATPRDGGVREARPSDDLLFSALSRAEVEATASDNLADKLIWQTAAWAIRAALSAPASAVPGERPKITEDNAGTVCDLEKAVAAVNVLSETNQQALFIGWVESVTGKKVDLDKLAALSAPGSFVSVEAVSDAEIRAAEAAVIAEWDVMRRQLRAEHVAWPVSPTNWRILRAGWSAIAKSRATPSPAQEPGTGDTGERRRGLPIEVAPKNRTILLFGTLGRDRSVLPAWYIGKWSEACGFWSAHALQLHATLWADLPTATPATTAETRGPAGQTKGGL